MIPIDGDFILNIAPHFSGSKADAQFRIVGEISAVLAPTLNSYGINTRLRIAHFMGQVTHECAGFRTTEEFASGADYEGRLDLGNTKQGDGKRYKGRGLIQLTGRHNYKAIGQILQIPLEDDPLLAAEPIISLKIACEYWKKRTINKAADRDDLIKATRLVNGGLNGLNDRRKYLQKAKRSLAAIEGIQVAVAEGGSSVILRRGSFGDAVREVQELLRTKGFSLSIDNYFGAATELAIMMFQKNNGLIVDGIVGESTWTHLRG